MNVHIARKGIHDDPCDSLFAVNVSLPQRYLGLCLIVVFMPIQHSHGIHTSSKMHLLTEMPNSLSTGDDDNLADWV